MTRAGEDSTDLLELVQVRCTLVSPQTRDILRRLEGLRRAPVLNHPRLIGRDDTVISVAILQANMSIDLRTRNFGCSYGHDMDRRPVQLVNGLQRFSGTTSIIQTNCPSALI